ncbi:MAG: hypothetical protein LBG15_06530 [Dysgonamonadaceae bacterium]|jgi:uncharacterized protein (TIGR02145 family)|nr:hypothetical protein [Dysgonamonadaceae bacterium]
MKRLNKMKKIAGILLAFCFLNVTNGRAQVNIGSSDDPHGGAVLDLSQVSDKNLGLLLPKVHLETSVSTWNLDGESDNGVGMIIFNTNPNISGGKGIGLYVWDGSSWNLLRASCIPVQPDAIRFNTDETCVNGTFTASVEDVPCATSYTWTISGTGLSAVAASTSNSIGIRTATAGTISRTEIAVTANYDCCSSPPAYGTGNVTVITKPDQPGAIQLSATTVNLNGTFTASVPEITGTAAPTSYTWTLPSGLTGSSTSRSITIKGVTAGTYAVGEIQVTASNACGTSAAQSSTSAVTVRPCTADPTISSPVADETKITKENVALPALSITADGKEATPTYQWQNSTTGGSNNSEWSNISEATEASFTAPVSTGGITYYRCVATTDCGSVTSKVFTVIVCATAVEDAEGNWYCTGNFGSAGTWMTMNLRSKQYAGGETLTEDVNSNKSDAAYYYYPNKDNTILSSHPEYGLLYTWRAATGRSSVSTNEGNRSDQTPYQGICPSGWHLPSDYEWSQLEKEIANSAEGTYGTGATTAWDTSWETADSYRGSHEAVMKSATAVNGQATNGTSKDLAAGGFDALLVGAMLSGSAINYGTYTAFLSSSSDDSTYAWYRVLYYNYTGVARGSNYKYRMYSVRCKKDDN